MKLQIIVSSVREGRVSRHVAEWVAREAEELHEDVTTEIVDLMDYPMPLFDEPISPQYNPNRQPKPEVQKWLNKLAEADAYVIVAAEYNRSMTGALKNALDYIDFQIAKKPVALIGHGSSGGAQAVATLRMALAGLKTFSTPTTTYIVGRIGEIFDAKGNLLDESIKESPYGIHASLKGTLEELKWYSDALQAAREPKPAAPKEAVAA
jgi:NAD(P)H-dependent FMN reductase